MEGGYCVRVLRGWDPVSHHVWTLHYFLFIIDVHILIECAHGPRYNLRNITNNIKMNESVRYELDGVDRGRGVLLFGPGYEVMPSLSR